MSKTDEQDTFYKVSTLFFNMECTTQPVLTPIHPSIHPYLGCSFNTHILNEPDSARTQLVEACQKLIKN
jgi:hypothetical protein